MNPDATYNVPNGRWLATLAIGLLVLAMTYSRTQVPTWASGLPLPSPALTSGECNGYDPLPATATHAFLPASPAPSLPPTSAWYPVARWLAAGDSPRRLATRLPTAGNELASQASALPAPGVRRGN